MNSTVTVDLRMVLLAGALMLATKQIDKAQNNSHIQEMARISNEKYALETERLKVEGELNSK